MKGAGIRGVLERMQQDSLGGNEGLVGTGGKRLEDVRQTWCRRKKKS